jgi:phosphoribosylaminoimidazolecarboxamide formyltransferase/IMP cyclohydrolase
MPPDDSARPLARALLSVFDKTGLVELGRGLSQLGVELVASGGTAAALRDEGLEVIEVQALTGSPEMLGGRVKTLHPKIHGGILARRHVEEDRAELERQAIAPIDLVVVNLYPFEETVATPGASYADIVEKIDIGGPSMLRSAAKNHRDVAVLADPADYAAVLAELRETGGLGEATRRRLALKAFQRTAAYDRAIQQWLHGEVSERDAEPEAGRAPLPEVLSLGLPRSASLRYGENPHQRAALYGSFLDGTARQLHGKELSYNNLVDVQAALALILDFCPVPPPSDSSVVPPSDPGAAVAILKHNTPCGVGLGATPLEAYRRAFETDPESPFGGVVVCSRRFDLALAEEVDKIFTEVLVAPSFSDEALALLRGKKNRRLLAFDLARIDRRQLDWKRIYGGVLLQEPDCALEDLAAAEVVTRATPAPEQLRALEFAWRVVKHVKSNAVVFAREGQTLAVGGGATSRVDAVHAAVAKASRVGLSLEGAALASDAFFPFPDGLEGAVAAGARSIIQPGGSNRDDQVIEAANRLGVAMIFTGVRHFRH